MKTKKVTSQLRRKNKQKAKRKAHAAVMTAIRQGLKTRRAEANIVAIKGKEEVVFGVRTGLFGHPTTTVLRVPHLKIVGGVEDNAELGEIVTQLGLLTLGSLLRFNLGYGPEELAKALARWVGIDLEALANESTETDEDGDTIVRTSQSDASTPEEAEARIFDEPALSEPAPFLDTPTESPEAPAETNE